MSTRETDQEFDVETKTPLDPAAVLTRMNAKYSLVKYGGKVRVLGFEEDKSEDGRVRHTATYFSVADFRLFYCNKFVEGVPLGKWWINHPERSQYDGVVFEPGK